MEDILMAVSMEGPPGTGDNGPVALPKRHRATAQWDGLQDGYRIRWSTKSDVISHLTRSVKA